MIIVPEKGEMAIAWRCSLSADFLRSPKPAEPDLLQTRQLNRYKIIFMVARN
jgi:hypothetical protein